ncbi:SMP-30/gluconolactonase/LRE family protein [Hymenobacter rubripertinctus]|uniref:SMP-30/gluconolactonase/LRE family protein n=1 Tax=Hymenobacter rubripertinctus TaxID=2029981 RepID=A0A418QRH1_9BACT|nr:SMP-30/gluconolactonase/LRE family protein [Hymenobacter rubripertinctus]RIY07816.1 SMP-30/gluconolactonase/LRE family protein [Hymenobacter rubripertinctus]
MAAFHFLLVRGTLMLPLLAAACTPRATSTAAEMAAAASPVAAGATPRVVDRQFGFTEGPAPDRAGNAFFTDQPNDQIWRYDFGTGQLSLFLAPAGRANGLYFDARGHLLACADGRNELWSSAPGKTVTVLLRDAGRHTLNGPNDLWVNPKTQGIYFTDPYYPRPYWTRQAPDSLLGGRHVYYLPPGHHSQPPVRVADQLRQPNGLIGTPDGRMLYVADIEANQTYRYAIGPDGRLSNRRLFAPLGSDGMTLDRAGNVYLTGEGVTVFSPAGQRIAHIAVPEKWTANVCFAGPNRKTLFITASEGVYLLAMRVAGAQ